MDEIKELQKGITEILVKLAQVETEIRQLNNMAGKLELTEKIANEALQSTKAAHKRLDELIKAIEEDKNDKKWVVGTILGAIALIWNFVKGGGTH